MLRIVPLFRKVDAAYYDKDTKEIFRSAVLGIWIYEGNPSFFDSDQVGYFGVPKECNSFLGYEFDGVHEDWTERIKTKVERHG